MVMGNIPKKFSKHLLDLHSSKSLKRYISINQRPQFRAYNYLADPLNFLILEITLHFHWFQTKFHFDFNTAFNTFSKSTNFNLIDNKNCLILYIVKKRRNNNARSVLWFEFSSVSEIFFFFINHTKDCF